MDTPSPAKNPGYGPVAKVYIFANSEDYFEALCQVKVITTYGKRQPVE